MKPMLAHTYEDHKNKVVYPGYVQPKLDGIRCVAKIEDGTCTLFSRNEKPITTVPHIVAALEAQFNDGNYVFDGELYNHDFKHDFNRIISIVKRKELHEDHKLVQYHIYDIVSDEDDYATRLLFLNKEVSYNKYLIKVVTKLIRTDDELNAQLDKMLNKGYEGLIYRNPDFVYENKRSFGLIKLKTFQDAEFLSIGIEEGKGKLKGKAGAIICVNKDGKEFKVKMEGSYEVLEHYFKEFNNYYIGTKLTVKFQNYTPAGIPRFPVGIRFRYEE